MRTFIIIWGGQVLSMMGTSMSRFALAIWVWEQTHEATPLVLTGISALIPALLSKFIAGPLIDRWDRRRVMMISDLIAGMVTVAILLLYTSGDLQVWHLYATSAIVGFVGVFQYLAYTASISMLLPKEHYARARGLMTLGDYISQIGAPLLGGILVSIIGIGGVLTIDIITFLLGVSALMIVRIPQPEQVAVSERKPLWRDSMSGFQYLFQRPGLLMLLGIAFTFSLSESLSYPLITPLILARTGDEVLLGTIRAAQGVGGVLGGVLLTIWGGPKRRIHAVLIGMALTGLLGDALIGIACSLPVWIMAAFFLEFFIPVLIGSYHAIWHSKIAPGMQGRVFAARDMIATLGEPLSMIFGGLFSDNLLEPAMMPGGSLAGVFGGLVGTGPGAGMGLLVMFGGILTTIAGFSGYLFRQVREVEVLLPDHDMIETAAQTVS